MKFVFYFLIANMVLLLLGLTVTIGYSIYLVNILLWRECPWLLFVVDSLIVGIISLFVALFYEGYKNNE